MTLEEFWRSTPRLTNLVVYAYLRRRAWAAYHAGAPGHFQNVTIEQLMGRAPRRKQMSVDEMNAAMRRIMVGVNAARKARGLSDGE